MKKRKMYLSLLMTFMDMTISSCSHDDEKEIPCDDCGKTRTQVVCEGADGVVSRSGSFVGGKVSGDGVYESDFGIVPVTATADDGYYVSYFRGGPKDELNKVDYAGTGEASYSTDANTELGNHMYHIGFKKKVVIYTNEITASNGGKASSTFSGESGTRQKITATPDNGYKFVQWNCTGGASVESRTSAETWATIGSSDGTITANFEVEIHSLTVTAYLPETWEELTGPDTKLTGWKGSLIIYHNGKQIGSIANNDNKSLSQMVTIDGLMIKKGDKISISGRFIPYCHPNNNESQIHDRHWVTTDQFEVISSYPNISLDLSK